MARMTGGLVPRPATISDFAAAGLIRLFCAGFPCPNAAFLS
jgi:hypothetical protein